MFLVSFLKLELWLILFFKIFGMGPSLSGSSSSESDPSELSSYSLVGEDGQFKSKERGELIVWLRRILLNESY